ncbi:MAG: HDOD domain-containing protein [Thiobacillaceae bacterium]|nr:HDOD domain-containing protein [Thiobacillaceae bacterium]
MNESGGFPALDHSVARIVEALEIGEEDTSPLVEAVLADVSLTQKVLRLANSAMYAPIGGSVSTVSHAMKVLGFEAVGHLALGVKLIGSLGQMRPDSRSAERELAQSLVAGSVAGSLVAQTAVKNGEMGMVCTLLHRLGQLLTAFYLPDEWARIQGAVEAGEDEKEAARAVLGMSLDELGTYIAGQWRLPARIVATLGDTTPPGESEEDAWLHALTDFSHRSADLITASAGKTPAPAMDELAATFAPLLGVRPGDLVAAVGAATDEATAEPLLAGILLEQKTAPAQSAAAAAPSRVPTWAAAAVPAPASAPAQTKVSRLQAGIAALRQAVAGQEDRRGIEQAALATVFDGLQLSRAAILLLDAQRRAYRVSACLRERESDRLAEVSIPSGAGADLVHLALARKLDVYIDNPRDEKIAPRLPAWIGSHGTHPFFLLPITDAAGEPMGLVFGQQREDVKLTREELGLLAELRDLLRRRLHADA